MKKLRENEGLNIVPAVSGLDYAAPAARLIVGLVLFISGYLKLLSPVEEFAAAIEAFQVLPLALVPWAAKTIPWAELFIGGFLAAGYLTTLSAVAAGSLNSAFFLALASLKIRGIAVGECGCFGSAGPHLEPWQVMILDAVLITLSAVLISRRRQINPFSLDRWIARGSSY
ncbi:MAG: DoxX family membrane protein [Elusimicrobia bacterium]|nr:DoxX family membrane protein [Elusimicrobiota bacterium]